MHKIYDKETEAEINCHGIEYPNEDGRNTQSFGQLSMKGHTDMLRADRMKILAHEFKAQDGIRPANIKYIVPHLVEMKALIAKINSTLIRYCGIISTTGASLTPSLAPIYAYGQEDKQLCL